MVEISFDTSYFEMNGIAYSRMQLPLQNAFALTVHKTQGLSLQSVMISFDSDMFVQNRHTQLFLEHDNFKMSLLPL